MLFEWDPDKNEANKEKHGLAFENVRELFESEVDFLALYDEEHSESEDRFMAIGPVRVGLVVVVYAERHGDVIRIISARKATKRESELYRRYRRGVR